MKLLKGDCLDLLATIEPGSVDLILADPPYGTTACKWDSIIPLAPMWWLLNWVIKPRGAIVLFGGEPFTSALRMSNIKNYKYDWVWEKNFKTGHLNAKKQPMRSIENICVFYKKQCLYYPQGISGHWKIKNRGVGALTNRPCGSVNIQTHTGYPDQVLRFNRDLPSMHPAQKPVALMEYLIKTYTDPGGAVLDFCMGSGTTGVAAVRTGRDFIGMELDKHGEGHFETARNRINLEILETR
jgi:site-specific DNA-methyltransferase (adenine-specific)